MAYIYAYAPDATDCAGIGLVGALLDEDARFDLKAGEFGELSFEHPVDGWGKWRALVNGAILKTMVPMRVCPELGPDGAYIASVDVYRVSATATQAQRYIYSASSGGKRKKLMRSGQEVTVTGVADASDPDSRLRVRLGRVSGWMEPGGLQLTRREVPVPADVAGLETAAPSYAVRQQLFRIWRVTPRTGGGRAGRVEVRARRIAYDLLGNVTTYRSNGSVSCLEACRGILDNTLMPHPFGVLSDIGDRHVGFDARDMNPIEALLDPAEGVAARWGAEVVSDDYDLYLLRRAGLDRGVRIEYGRNLVGVEVRADASACTDAIRPKGEAKDGSPLYLDGRVVSGRHGYNRTGNTCADWLPEGLQFYTAADGTVSPSVIVRTGTRSADLPRIDVLDVRDARVEKGSAGVTPAIARRMLAAAAAARFAAGCDAPELSMRVDFVLLGDTAEYAQYRHLEPLFIYDTVHVSDPRVDVRADIAVTSVSWLVRQERVAEAGFGALKDLAATVSGWQISGLSGGKLLPGTVGAGQLAADAVSANHIQANSINTDALQANAVTAAKMATDSFTAQTAIVQKLSSEAIAALTATINAITAGDISTNTLSAAFAHLMQVVADNIQAGTVTADALDAVMASIVSISVGAATFDLAEIQNLLASALVLDEGQAGSMHITNLAVTSANLLNATVGKLVIKGDDDNYYEVGVGSDGVIRTAQYDATAQEIADGRTTDGRQIVTETINAEAITGETVKAQEAVLNRVLTAALTAGQITANDAMLASASIPLLYATSIRALGNSLDLSANETIQLLVGVADSVRRWFTFDADGLRTRKAGSKWSTLIDDVGYHIDHDDVNGHVGSFHKERLTVHGVQIGDIVVRPTGINHTGGWAWVDA